MRGSATINALAILRWLLRQPPGQELSYPLVNLPKIKKELSEDFWEPASLSGISKDDEIDEIYRRLCHIAGLMRDGKPVEIDGYTVHIPEAGEITIQPAFMRASANRYESIVLCAVLMGRNLLRRCIKCKADVPVLFIRNKRKVYCTKKCSGLKRKRAYQKKHR
jgi:hypothetical protein